MVKLIHYFPVLLVIAFPFVFSWVYLNSLRKKADLIIKSHTNDSSELYSNLNVWVQNFDILEKTKLFPPDPFQTNYDFYNCDLILNENDFIIIGKTSILGINIPLIPTIFQFKKVSNQNTSRSAIVEVISLKEKENDLELGFTDPAFKNEMILVIKRINPEIKSKILNRYYKAVQE